ncbi:MULTISPECIES: hypothetical protein [unclassified Mesorhizobium]|uniref:hypothetical protein n=1 Tax=unclassified Mesorhizobium TaxID=325217 RepID=UPI00333BAA02
MASHASSGDSNGVREGFEQCQDGNDDEIGKVQECARERPQDLLRVAREVYGIAEPSPPPAPEPKYKPVTIKFEEAMQVGEGKHELIANFTKDIKGKFANIEMQFYRNEKKTWRVATYDVSVSEEGEKTHFKISSWDRYRKVTGRKYVVTGEITMLVPE